MQGEKNRQRPLRWDVPPARQTKGIVRLEIHAADGGYYLFQFLDKNAPPQWDSFYSEMDEIFEDCERGWGVERNAWQPIGG